MGAASVTLQCLTSTLKTSLPQLSIIAGEEWVLIHEAKQTLERSARQHGYEETIRINIEKVGDLEQLSNHLNSPSLFYPRSWIDCTITASKMGKKGYDSLQSYCDSLNMHQCLTLTLPNLDYGDRKQKWFGKLSQNALLIEAKTPTGKALSDWVQNYCKQQNLTLNQDQENQLLASTDGNLSACAQEIQKLALLADGKPLTNETLVIALSDSSTFTIFQCADYALKGNISELNRVLRRLHQQELSPVLMLWSLVRELRMLIQIKADLLKRKPWDDIAREHRLWSSRQILVKNALNRLSIQKLLDLLSQAARLEPMIKGLAPGNVNLCLDTLFFAFAGHTPIAGNIV